MNISNRRRASKRRLPKLVAALAAIALIPLAGGIESPAAAYEPTPHTKFAGEPLPMGQANNMVLAVQVAGGKIFAGGTFTSTRPAGAAAGTGETGQAYLAAFDANTGQPLPSFAPKLENRYTGGPATVRALTLSADKRTLYVAGDFNTINGRNSEHIAKFDTATGNYLGEIGLNGVNGQVNALALSPDGKTLYAGGAFNKANWGVDRVKVAAFDLATGDLKPWHPKITGITRGRVQVNALAVSTDNTRVFMGGQFRGVNGVATRAFAATYASNSQLVPGFISTNVMPGTVDLVPALAINNGQLYIGGRADSQTEDRNEGVTSISEVTGARKWYSGCFGDTAAILPVANDIYVANHAHDCAPSGFNSPVDGPLTYLGMTAHSPATGQMRPYWITTEGNHADSTTVFLSRALATDGNQLVMGGGFNTTNGKAQANIARFATGNAAPSRAPWPSASSCTGCNYNTVKVLLAGDRDDLNLKYELFRNNDSTPVYALSRQNQWLEYTTAFTYKDARLPGTKTYYRVKATDSSGASTWSVRTPVITTGQAATQATTSTMTARTPSMEPSTSAQRLAEKAADKAGLTN